MKTKTLWLIWLYLFAFSCILGFIPNPPVAVKALLVVMGIAFFIPGGFLLKRGTLKTVKLIRLLSIGSLAMTTVFVVLNYLSFLMNDVWGTVFHIILGIVSTPMYCFEGWWAIGLFGWACLMSASFFKKK